MDLAAEFYLQTVETVFVKHALPKGEMMHRRTLVDPSQDPPHARCSRSRARRTTSPASARPKPRTGCAPAFRQQRKAHYLQLGVGHYGVFNGSRFRAEIAPRIADFMFSHNGNPRRSAWRRVAAKA